MARRKKKAHHFSGGFAGIPRIVMDNPDYIKLSGNAIKMLNILAYQFKGSNNGDLTLARSILIKMGLGNKKTIARCRDELIAADMIMVTRQGRFTNPNGCCNLYALTWHPIDECNDKLDIKPTRTAPRIFSFEKNKKPSLENGQDSSQKVGRQRQRNSKGQFDSSQKVGRLTVVA